MSFAHRAYDRDARPLSPAPSERPIVFELGGDQLIGVLTHPQSVARARGVLIVVGGPQYRVGSHRQFVLLARRLAAEGYPTFRFDCRGMGDSSGAMRDFEHIGDDIAAGIDVFVREAPDVKEVVIWGLCDAASAAMMFATADPRVHGLVLVNPWARSAASLAKTHLKHYYGARLLQWDFWRSVLRGQFRVGAAVRSLWSSILQSRQVQTGVGPDTQAPFQIRMAQGLRRFAHPALMIFADNDLTAKEFLDYAGIAPEWIGLLGGGNVTNANVVHADHTFSTAKWRREAEDLTVAWLGSW